MNETGTPAERPLALVVDDDDSSRRAVRATLEIAGFDVEEAANGREGVVAFERLKPEITLMDGLMPEMDGFSACAAIRAMPLGRHAPILMMTSRDDKESIRRAYEAGATDLATKPVDGVILGYRVGRLLRSGRAFEEASRSERKNRALLSAIPDLILRTSRDGVILGAETERRTVRPSRYEPYLGKSVSKVLPPEAAGKVLGLLERADTSGGLHAAELEFPDRRGVRHLEARVAANGDSEVIVFVRDITRRKRREQRLSYLAYNDPLTGLANRTRFAERLREELARSRRYRDAFAVAIVRLDRYKEIVEEYGHDLGNRILRNIARRLSDGLRETDMIARIAHFEFALLLAGQSSEHSVFAAIRRVLDRVSQEVRLDERSFVFTACAGATLATGAGDESVSALLRQSDVALGRARGMGRNHIQMYSQEMSDNISRRVEMEVGLRAAVDRREFVVHFQPVVDLRTGRISGAEALVRWRHPDKGLVPPMQFIPLAEETGIIVPITAQVALAACRQARAWQEEGFGPLSVAVNISGRVFQHQDVADMLSRVTGETELAPRHLEIEITESVAMHDFAKTLETLRRLQNTGIRAAIDDFGTGHSSLAYLKRFPIHQLKIDRSFIRDMMGDPGDRAIVDAVIAMAHSMNMEVLAEGVERADQADYLRAKGCDKAQGYHFGKPVPAEEFRELLSRQEDRVGPGPRQPTEPGPSPRATAGTCREGGRPQ